MLQLRNASPFRPAIFVFPDELGVDTLYVALKATFEASRGALRVAERQRPFVRADEPHDAAVRPAAAPGASSLTQPLAGPSLKYATEAHLSKRATDVVLVGDAWAPRGRPAPEVDVTVRVGPVAKVVRVFGDRAWRRAGAGLKPSAPQPFVRVPLVYERAFGGAHAPPGAAPQFEPRNPVGVGFRGGRPAHELEGTPLPNLEDPRALLGDVDDQPPPACFGFVAPAWEPRKALAGTYDATWRRTRAPYLPADFDPRWFNAAAPELVCPGFLRGRELVEVHNASPEGVFRCQLPACPASVVVVVDGALEPVRLELETVLLEPGDGLVSLTYRAALTIDKRVLGIEEVRIEPTTAAGGAS